MWVAAFPPVGMGTNAFYTEPSDLNILDPRKMMDARMNDITRLQQKQNEVLDALQFPGHRIPSDFITY
eukprot:11065587-Prorocentrum_lima.AAC.1